LQFCSSNWRNSPIFTFYKQSSLIFTNFRYCLAFEAETKKFKVNKQNYYHFKEHGPLLYLNVVNLVCLLVKTIVKLRVLNVLGVFSNPISQSHFPDIPEKRETVRAIPKFSDIYWQFVFLSEFLKFFWVNVFFSEKKVKES